LSFRFSPFSFACLLFGLIQKVEAKERENGLMDLLGIKSTTQQKMKERRERNIAAVRDAAAVSFDIVDTIRQRVDRGRRKSKKKKSTAGDVVPHPSISILFLFFLFPPFFLSLFILPLFYWVFLE